MPTLPPRVPGGLLHAASTVGTVATATTTASAADVSCATRTSPIAFAKLLIPTSYLPILPQILIHGPIHSSPHLAIATAHLPCIRGLAISVVTDVKPLVLGLYKDERRLGSVNQYWIAPAKEPAAAQDA